MFGNPRADHFDLFEAPIQSVPIVGVPRQAHRSHMPASFAGSRYARLDSKFITLVHFPFAYAFYFRSVYAVDFVFVAALLGVNPSGCFQNAGKGGTINKLSCFAFDVADDSTQNRAKLFLTFVRSIKLPGLRVALLLDQQVLANALVVLAQADVMAFGLLDKALTGTIIQTAVRRLTDVFFLSGGVDVDTFELTRFYRFELQTCTDCLGE